MSEDYYANAPPAKRAKTVEIDDSVDTIAIPTDKEAPRNDAQKGWSRELECGVSAFLNPSTLPFTCLFKHRFSDFLVNEIDQSGKVLYLTTSKPELLDVPKQEPEIPAPANTSLPVSSSSDVAPDTRTAEEKFQELMNSEPGPNDLDVLLEFSKKVDTALTDSSEDGKAQLQALRKENISLACGSRSKDWRSAFHKLLRETFPQLRSETVTKDNVTTMRIWFGTDKYDRARARNATPARYLRMVLVKENKDTTEAIHLVTRLLGLKKGQVRFAGTKDKRGVTTQALTIPFLEVTRVSNLNAKLIGNTKVGNFSAVNSHLALGDLRGNRFQVILRDIKIAAPRSQSSEVKIQTEASMQMDQDALKKADDYSIDETIEALKSSCEKFSESGFINYYGMQRFGTGSLRTHEVGLACLRGDWKLVVDLILRPRDGERADATKARAHYAQTQNAAESLKLTPYWMLNERLVLQGLAEASHKSDFKSAFDRLARPMRLMYPHAYQSYIWNMAASRRIELYGFQVVKGDLVVKDSSVLLNSEAAEEAAMELEDVPGKPETGKKAEIQVHVVESDEEAKQYTMLQVVIPLPGPKITLPKNAIGEYILELLEKDGLDLAFKNDREFHLTGDYRPLIVRPSDFEYHILRYHNPDEELQSIFMDEYVKEMELERKPLKIDPHGNRLALQLIFSLPSSAYASCLVRELVKQPLDQGFLRDTLATATSSQAPKA